MGSGSSPLGETKRRTGTKSHGGKRSKAGARRRAGDGGDVVSRCFFLMGMEVGCGRGFGMI